MKEQKNKKFVNYIIIGLILAILIGLGVEEYKETQIGQKQIKEDTQNYVQDFNNIENQEITEDLSPTKKEYPKEEVIEEYKGYDVIAKLEIPEIELETYILKNYSEKALKISVTKFWGSNPNEIGNFCVAGHNFINKNMFHNLKKLEVGDKFTVSDNTIGKIEYEIYDIYTVLPEDVSCLTQETNGNREVTLITCTNNSKKRIIVKAKEVSGKEI